MPFSVLFTVGAASLFLSTTVFAQHSANSISADKSLAKNALAMNMPSEPATVETAKTEAPEEKKDFKGTVVDELGEPVAGAVVSIVAGKNQFSVTTTTNAEGEYVISSTSASPLLLVTYAGYADVQQKATYAQPITFQLESIDNYDRKLKKQVKTAGKARRN